MGMGGEAPIHGRLSPVPSISLASRGFHAREFIVSSKMSKKSEQQQNTWRKRGDSMGSKHRWYTTSGYETGGMRKVKQQQWHSQAHAQ